MRILLSLACCMLAPPAADAMPAGTGTATAFAAAGVSADSVRAHNRARNAVRAYLRRATAANVHELRHDVVDELDRYAREIPGDDWIAGHRIGMRVKQGWYSAAASEALRCQGSAWWCSALAGFALHAEGGFAEADRAFDRALGAMPRSLRCAWAEELLLVLDGELRTRYGAADCDGRIAMEARIWWLADPLHLLPGNDRRTEHYARMVGMQLHHELLAVAGRQPCAHDHHETILRHGWPEWWWGPGPLEGGAEGGRFIPPGAVFAAPLDAGPDQWLVEAGTRTERYAPGYGVVRDLEQQTAFFARGDSIAVVTAALFGRTRLAGVALSRDESAPPVVVPVPEGGAVAVQAMVPRGAYLVSVEAVREPAGAARARFGHRMPEPTPEGLAISDLLVFNWGPGLAETLEVAAARALPGTRFGRNRNVAIYWEVYGATADVPVEVSLSVIPEEPGLVARLGQTLRLAAARDGAAVRWEDTPLDDALAQHLRIDLSSLPAGRYTLQLEVRQPHTAPATARRVIELLAI